MIKNMKHIVFVKILCLSSFFFAEYDHGTKLHH